MFIHSVYFWLRDDLSAEARQRFVDGIRSLTTIESVAQGFIGTPAATDREIIDRSYSYALVVSFADEVAHEVYQVHPVHDRFREQCGTFWTTVRIYDSVEGDAPSGP